MYIKIFLIDIIFLLGIFYYIDITSIIHCKFEFHLLLLIIWIFTKIIYFVYIYYKIKRKLKFIKINKKFIKINKKFIKNNKKFIKNNKKLKII